MNSITIKGENGSVCIQVLRYEHAKAENSSDANWLTSTVQLTVGSFSANLSLNLTTQDFRHFHHDLTKMLETLSGKAIFETPEEGIVFEIEMGSRGNAKVRGKAAEHASSRSTLTFEFDTDQSYLALAKTSLAEVIQNFPVKG